VPFLSPILLGMMALLPISDPAFSLSRVPAGVSGVTPALSRALAVEVDVHPLRSSLADQLRLEAGAQALLRRWSPNFAQEASAAHPERDQPLRVDFDGDWAATNNWSHLTAEQGRAQPVVYGSAILTSTYAYLFFTLFYPRDWSSPVCISYLCHDNDLEAALLVVRRASTPERDELVFVETKAHLAYVALRAAELASDAQGRPWIRVESEGHGMYPVPASEPVSGTAQRLVLANPAGSAEASGMPGRGYELVSLHDTLWARRDPAAAQGELWTSGSTGFLTYTGARLGRRGHRLGVAMAGHEYAGGVRPPWGLEARAGARGDWFLDPAYVALLQHREWFAAQAPSLEYVFNPFLDDLTLECSGLGCPAILPPPFPNRTRMGVMAGLVVATGLVSLRARRRVLARCRRWSKRWRAR